MTNINPYGSQRNQPKHKGYDDQPEVNRGRKPVAAASAQLDYGQEDAGGYLNDDENVCNFCDRFDPNFNSESIDIHYWKECPMLTTCWECEQVIEIQQMQDHLVDECQNSDRYKYHDTCKQVYVNEEFNGHDCVKPKPAGAGKCALCSLSVFPNTVAGWKKHIMQDRCMGNQRLPK